MNRNKENITGMEKVRSSLVNYWEVLLIYPALFLYIFSNDLNLIAQHGLVYRKLCLREYNETICNSIQSIANANNSIHVQELSSQAQIILNVAFIAPAIVSIIHLSSIADRRLNYELPLVVSLIGSLVQAFMCIFAVNAHYTLFFTLLVVAQVINGICGAGSLSFISSCFSHVSVYESRKSPPTNIDESDQNRTDPLKKSEKNQSSSSSSSNRSIRYSICESCLLFGQFVGSLSSGYLIGNKINLANFVRVYVISFLIYAFVLVYTIVMFRYLKKIKNAEPPARPQTSLDLMSAAANTSDSELPAVERRDEETSAPTPIITQPRKPFIIATPSKSCIKNQFHFLHETWQLLSKPRENNDRFLIVSLLIMFYLGCSLSMGIMSLQYLYLIKKPIQLSQVNYGLFKALNTFCRALALLVILPVLKKAFKTPDYILFLLGFTSEFLNLVVFSLSYFFRYAIWLGPISYMCSNYFVVCIRSFSSKIVDKNETGKYFSLIGVIEFLVLLTSSSIFSLIYRYTVAFFPPLVFFLGCLIALFICYPFLIYILRCLSRHQTLK